MDNVCDANFIDTADMPVSGDARTTSQSYQRRKHAWKPKVVKFERWMRGAGVST